MPTTSIILAAIAGILHVLFFLMESVFWMQPNVYKTFGVRNAEDAEKLKLTYFNQGFYNLFLAAGVFAGIYFLQGEQVQAGQTLVLFCCGSMFGASMVLLFSKPGMLRGVLIQGLAPLLAILCWWFCR